MYLKNISLRKHFLNKPIYYLLLSTFILSSCSGLGSKNYSCETIQPWMASVTVLADGVGLNHIPAAKLANRLAPAFNDDAFKPVFGKSYSALDKKEREGIRLALKRCYPAPWVGLGISIPFQYTDQRINRSQAMWQRAIKIASYKSYAATVAQRKQRKEAHKLALKRYAEQKRKRREQAKIERQKSNDKWSTIAKGAAIIIGGIMLAETMSGEDKNKYSEYGNCAPALRKRLVRCSVGIGECTLTGCENDVNCRGKNARSCRRRIQNIYFPKNVYYCDSENSRNYDPDKATIINQICASK